MYVKATTLTEIYGAENEFWRKRNPDLRTNIEEKLLLNLKNYVLRSKKRG
jgi:hypothetical protein